MEIERYLEVDEERALELVLVNRSAPAPVRPMVEVLFADQPVGVSETEQAGTEDDMMVLSVDGTLLAKSPLQALLDSILLVNSDLFISGSGGFEDVAVPAVIDALTDTRFSLQGYPESN